MVNELNKPQDNSALSELLAASNRQLHEMQEEHRQLQEELSRLSVQRQQLRQATREHHSQVTSSSTSTVMSSSASEVASESRSVTEGAAGVQQTEGGIVEEAEEEDNEETAKYLQEKLNEIANLKAQFKRVQNITDSTKLIEQHLSSVESQSSSSVMQSRQTKTMESIQSSSSTSSSSTSRSAQSLEAATSAISEAATAAISEARAAPDNAELLNAMINMVTDFTSDLRGQEESLRAERLRIKTLKEEIIQRKQSKE
ncbi:hypothetical protein KR044_013052 [Drosophila immigrans]|nr:hypothetical protein KR044_013052 [Drosophila immigrans]